MSRDDYESELTGSRADIAAVLHGVADGILAGSVRLGEDADAVAADVPADLSLEIELEAEDDEVELELELEWPAPADGSAVSSVQAATDEDSTDEVATDEPADGAATEETADEVAAEETADGAATDEPADEVATEETTDEVATDETVAVPVPDPALAGAADGSSSLARFELFRDRADEWRWRLRHRNGNIIATGGEGYTRKHNAVKGLRSVMSNASGAEVVADERD